MPINPDTKFTHPELGPISFDDGKPIPHFTPKKDSLPQWICRPDGGDPDFEIYISGDAHAPQGIDQAIAALHHREQIEAAGKSLSTPNAHLAWIDLTINPPGIAFCDSAQVYVIWKGRLDDKFGIQDFKQEAW